MNITVRLIFGPSNTHRTQCTMSKPPPDDALVSHEGSPDFDTARPLYALLPLQDARTIGSDESRDRAGTDGPRAQAGSDGPHAPAGSDKPCARAGDLMISDMKMPPEKAVSDYATLMDDMYSLLDTEVDSLSKPWKGSLPFECYIIEDKTTICEQTFLEPPQLVEICDYLEGQMYPVQRL